MGMLLGRAMVQAIYIQHTIGCRDDIGHTTPFMVFSVMYTICKGLKLDA